jgi:uncharacterized tellurite resistance protein B-like protein
MIKSLKALFSKPTAEEELEIEHQLQLAAAALLIEMSRADFEVQSEERSALESVLSEALNLSDGEVAELVTLGAAAADRATSLYEFTRLINDHYSRQQKHVLVESMWKVAFADCNLDKYEERLIRQVSDLIHVSHSDFIRLKLKVSAAKNK